MKFGAHNSVLGRNTYATLAVLLIFTFTLIGLWFGTPQPGGSDTFGELLRKFTNDDKTRTILAFIMIDIATGVMCALRLRIFDIQRLANFYASSVLPYILGYLLVWCIALFGLDAILPSVIQSGLASLGFAAIVTSLSGSIIDNIQRMATPLSYTENTATAQAPKNPQG